MMAQRLAAAGAALAVVLGAAAVFWWPALRDRLALSNHCEGQLDIARRRHVTKLVVAGLIPEAPADDL